MHIPARYIASMMVAALLGSATAPASRAADLRVDHAELAKLVSAFTTQASVVLNNVPGGFFGLGSTPATVTIGSTTIPVPIPVRPFDVAGARLVYYVNDVKSTKVSAVARPGAVRLTITFEESEPELVGECVSSFCPPDAVLPNIEWKGAAVHADLVPDRQNGSVTLRAKAVKIDGDLEPTCRSNAGPITGWLCRQALPKARAAVGKVRTDIETTLRDQINSEMAQKTVAEFLKKYLSIGAAGEVQIAKIAVDTKGVLVSFRFAAQ